MAHVVVITSNCGGEDKDRIMEVIVWDNPHNKQFSILKKWIDKRDPDYWQDTVENTRGDFRYGIRVMKLHTQEEF